MDKLFVTKGLRENIVESRKKLGLSAYDLSEKSGHSKYWLPNIENGKTQKISKEDLISLYTILLDTSSTEVVIQYIEQIIQQPLSAETSWYNLQTTQKSNITAQKSNVLDHLFQPSHSPEQLKNDINNKLSTIKAQLFKIISDQPIKNQQAALNALENFRLSVVFNPELTLALMNIPLYGVDIENQNEYSSCINDLTILAAKYNDLSNRLEIQRKIYTQEKINAKLQKENQKTVQQVSNSFYYILSLLKDQLSNNQCSNFSNLLNLFYSSVVESLKRLVSDNLESEIPDISEIKTGDNFCDLLKYCSTLLITLRDDYYLDLPHFDSITNYAYVISEIRKVPTIQ